MKAHAQAEFIYYVFDAYKKQSKKYGTENMKKSSDCLNYAIRGLDKVLGANFASKDILDKYSREELKGAVWNKFKSVKYAKDKDTHFEHAFPVSTMKKKLIDSDFTKGEAVNFILTNYACCFISAEENNRLNKAGFNSKRPDGWKDAYKQVGIEFTSL